MRAEDDKTYQPNAGRCIHLICPSIISIIQERNGSVLHVERILYYLFYNSQKSMYPGYAGRRYHHWSQFYTWQSWNELASFSHTETSLTCNWVRRRSKRPQLVDHNRASIKSVASSRLHNRTSQQEVLQILYTFCFASTTVKDHIITMIVESPVKNSYHHQGERRLGEL